MDSTKIGELTAALMDDLDKHFGEGTEIGAVCLVVEAISPDGDSNVISKYSDPRRHIVLGLLEVARRAAG